MRTIPMDALPVDIVTLDGSAVWIPLGGPVPILHDVDAYLRERGLAKLTDDERRAHGLPLAAPPAAATEQ